jgi:hypothetical protein
MLMEILAEVEKFPINNCEVFFKAWKHGCHVIKPLRKYFHENKDIYGKFPRKFSRFGKFTSIDGNFPCIDGIFPMMIS